MIFGTDTSSYQPIGTYDPGSFEIVNALDPTLPNKIARNRADGRPWGIYSWVFPGESGAYTVGRAINALNKVGGPAPLGLWWDYEQDGVEQWQLDECFVACDQQGMWSGYYANMWRPNHVGLLARPYWCCAYPWPNDGSFPGLERLPAGRDINIWQYSSTNGQLDLNVIIDEAWYTSLTGGAPQPQPPTPAPTIKECDMYVGWGTDDKGVMFTDKIDGGITVIPFGGEVSPYGFYQDGYNYATGNSVPFVLMTADEIAFSRMRNFQVRNPPCNTGPNVETMVSTVRGAILASPTGTSKTKHNHMDVAEAAIRSLYP